MARLVVSEAGGVERIVELAPPRLVVGTDGGCDVVLDCEGVSAEHCEIREVMGAWKIVDLESRDGVRVNGAYVNQHPLNGGDVVEVGAARLVFEDDARSGAAAVEAAPLPVAAPVVRPSGRSRGGPVRKARKPAPVAGSHRRNALRGRNRPPEALDEDDDRPRRRPVRKKKDPALMIVLFIAAVVILGGGGMLIMQSATSESTNRGVYVKMLSAEKRLDWNEVIRLSEGAVPSEEDLDYGSIMKLRAKAVQQLENDKLTIKLNESIKGWNQVRLWRQKHWHDDDDYLLRLDAYLGEYGHLGGAGVDLARKERAKLTGSAYADEPKTADAAWERLQADTDTLASLGRFGAALDKAEAFRGKWGGRSGHVDRIKRELDTRAGRYLGEKISLAQRKADQGAWLQARKTLEKVADEIGIPEYADRARSELEKLLATR